MKQVLHKLLLSMILSGGLFIGMVKGQEVKQKWIAKMKDRYEGKESASHKNTTKAGEVLLDEYEIAAYHS
ncbi:MAG: hypothetical protein JWM28_1478 [Chitinophagaceae bacterium]|nr:hypothetical protein [Chitinophagaceae bacterium]